MIPGEFSAIEEWPPRWWLRFTKWLRREDDPVKHCDLYKDKAAGSCAHVDGPLCDFPGCSMLKDYREQRAHVSGVDLPDGGHRNG